MPLSLAAVAADAAEVALFWPAMLFHRARISVTLGHRRSANAMQHIRSEIDIAASADAVWGVLADFSAYPAWNPFIRAISGKPSPGARLDVTFQPDGGKVMSFKPRLLVFEPQKELRWKGQVLAPGIFDGEHYFQLTEPAPGRVHFVHGEVFSGLLVPLVLRGSMRAGTERSFAAMNQALKARAEAQR